MYSIAISLETLYQREKKPWVGPLLRAEEFLAAQGERQGVQMIFRIREGQLCHTETYTICLCFLI